MRTVELATITGSVHTQEVGLDQMESVDSATIARKRRREQIA